MAMSAAQWADFYRQTWGDAFAPINQAIDRTSQETIRQNRRKEEEAQRLKEREERLESDKEAERRKLRASLVNPILSSENQRRVALKAEQQIKALEQDGTIYKAALKAAAESGVAIKGTESRQWAEKNIPEYINEVKSAMMQSVVQSIGWQIAPDEMTQIAEAALAGRGLDGFQATDPVASANSIDAFVDGQSNPEKVEEASKKAARAALMPPIQGAPVSQHLIGQQVPGGGVRTRTLGNRLANRVGQGGQLLAETTRTGLNVGNKVFDTVTGAPLRGAIGLTTGVRPDFELQTPIGWAGGKAIDMMDPSRFNAGRGTASEINARALESRELPMIEARLRDPNVPEDEKQRLMNRLQTLRAQAALNPWF